MIPSDLSARLRLLTEASFFETDQPVQALNRVPPIPADLPEFTPGQRLTAVLERPLPDGMFRAMVAGKTVTLALPQNTDSELLRPGQSLAVEITRSTAQALHAEIVPLQGEAEAPPALSQTARMISVLLTGQPPSEPAALAAGQPLLAKPPANGSSLVPVLQEALSQSGLFYESHQAQWLTGKISTAALRQEPQGQVPVPSSNTENSAPPRTEAATLRSGTPSFAVSGEALSVPQPAAVDQQVQDFSGAEPERRATPEPTPAATPRNGAIPERLLPLVSQQLDALATQQFVWQGQVWPGQHMEWRIEDPGARENAPSESQMWNTSLRLILPRLGSVEVRLQLTANGVGVRVLAADPAAQSALAAGREALARGLAAVDLPLLNLSVEPAGEHP